MRNFIRMGLIAANIGLVAVYVAAIKTQSNYILVFAIAEALLAALLYMSEFGDE